MRNTLYLLALLAAAPLAAAHRPATVVALDARSVSAQRLEELAMASTPQSRLTLAGLRDDQGETVTLELRRAEPFTSDVRIYADDELLDAQQVLGSFVVMTGRVTEWPDSVATLTLDRRTGDWQGILARGGAAYSVQRPGRGDSSRFADLAIVRRTMDDAEPLGDDEAGTMGRWRGRDVDGALRSLTAPAGSGHPHVTATLAIDGDYEFFQIFGNVDGAMAYIATLYATVSGIYEQYVDSSIRVGEVILRTNSNDPYNRSDSLGELGNWWHDNRPAEQNDHAAVILITGRKPPGYNGIAWVGGLCSTDEQFDYYEDGSGLSWAGGYSVVTAAGADPSNKVYVNAHEIGHLYGSGHTHCYHPPIDLCNAQCFPAEEAWEPEDGGSIMSYCKPAVLSMGEPGKHGNHSERVPALINSFLRLVIAEAPGCLEVDGDSVYGAIAVGGSKSIQVSWTDTQDGEKQWLVEVRQGTGKFKVAKKLKANATAAEITGLKAGSYEVRLRAQLKKGYSPYSDTLPVTVN